MRKLLEQVKSRLTDFIAQQDDVALVVRAGDAEAMLLMQILEAEEDASTADMFWRFAEPFETATDYVNVMVAAFAARHQLVRLLQAKEGMRQWPEMPVELQDAGLGPAQRLRRLMIFARTLLPAPDGAALVWVLFPGNIANRQEYGRFIAELLRHDFPFPWCHHMRIFVRDVPVEPALPGPLRDMPHVSWYAPDLSPHTLNQALEQEADDAELPLEQRLQSLLLTAAHDYAHKDYAAAQEKYQLVLDFFAPRGDLVMAALALNGLGEVHRAQGRMAEASQCFEAALVPATDGPNPPLPVMFNVMLNLGALRVQQGNWPEAEVYYDGVQKLATVLRSGELKVQALQQLGLAQHHQGKLADAVTTWTAGATVAKKLKLPQPYEELVQRLRDHFGQVRDAAGLRAIEDQLAATEVVEA